MSYTPGPWRVVPMRACVEIVADDADVWVAKIEALPSGDNVMADAEIIAAAPDMAEALRGFFDGVEFIRPLEELGDEDVIIIAARRFKKARAALAKAGL